MTITLTTSHLVRRRSGLQGASALAKGSIIMRNNSGHLIPAANAANGEVVGWVDRAYDAPSGGAGTVEIEYCQGIALLVASSITQAMEGHVMYVVDEYTVDDAVGTYGTKVGPLVRFVSTTSGYVLIDGNSKGQAAVSADATDAASASTLANELKTLWNRYA